MATPAQLMETLSHVTGVPLPTVVDIDRRLVKAGLRTKGGRGLNAARMTPLDAARLLTALLASPQATLSVEAVYRYAQTGVDRALSSEKLFAGTKLEELAALPKAHGFVDALEALIASAAAGALAKMIAKLKTEATPRIEVFAFTRATRGRIRLSGLPNRTTASLEYVPVPNSRTVKSADPTGDLEQSRRVTERTILPVARLLGEESL